MNIHFLILHTVLTFGDYIKWFASFLISVCHISIITIQVSVLDLSMATHFIAQSACDRTFVAPIWGEF